MAYRWRTNRMAIVVSVILGCAAVVLLLLNFGQPAPPASITIATGPVGSNFQSFAKQYQKILARNKVQLVILTTGGSLDNLKKMTEPGSTVDIALVQGGMEAEGDIGALRSLGSLFYEPIIIAYRKAQPIQRLSELQGKRIAIGPEGSGARFLAGRLLKANGIEAGEATTLLPLTGRAALEALTRRDIDALILQDDTASVETIRKIVLDSDIRLFDFPQADAYVRRFRFLSKLDLPPGSFDLGLNIPAMPLVMLAPTVELIARADLHPALSDLLIEAAQEVHGGGGLLHHPGEFPAPLEHQYPISADATRYYQSGKSLVYRHVPFWLASLVSRVAALVVPLAVILIPAVPFIPAILGWRNRSRISRHSLDLLDIERSAIENRSPDHQAKLLRRLGVVESAILSGQIPGYLVNEIHVLRQHIRFVRGLLAPAAEDG